MLIKENSVVATRANIFPATSAGRIKSSTLHVSSPLHKADGPRSGRKPLPRISRHAGAGQTGSAQQSKRMRGTYRANQRVRHVTFLDQTTLTTALSGDDAALNQLVNILTPVIQARVARRLLRSPMQKDVRQDVKDLTQDIFLHLFENNARVLHAWDPERGMSLENYVGLISERRAISHFRSGKSNPWREQDNLDDVQEPHSVDSDIERQVMNEEALNNLLHTMRERLSPLGWRLFELLYIQEQSVEQIQTKTNMKADAIYAWRSRLRKLAHQCQQQLMNTGLTQTGRG